MNTSLSFLSKETDKDFVHQTIHVYESLFEPIRFSVTNILEIGINVGNSHRMWRDYFYNATVYGIDIANLCNSMEGEDRVIAIIDDAYSEKMVEDLSPIKFDIIIDDGPHSLETQIFTVQKYSSLLKDNGILIVEDIPDPDWIRILTEQTPDEFKKYSYGIDRRWASKDTSWFHDELLFVIDKRFVGI